MTVLSPEAAARLDSAFQVDIIERDRPWGRPLLIPGEELAKAPLVVNPKNRKPRTDGKLPYTRASSFADYVADHTALEVWRMRSAVYGLAQRPDLQARAAACPPLHSNVKSEMALTRQEKADDKLTKALLDEIADEAQRTANRDFKADWGTAIHGFTDPGPHGAVPERMQADVSSWERQTAAWTFHATEVFTACDRYQVAGTFDHIVTIPWRPDLGALIVDKKTGLLHLDKFAIQCVPYAEGEHYDGYTDTRRPLEELTGGVPVNKDWAIIAHIPLGLGRTDFYLVNLEAGRDGCEEATRIRRFRQRPIDDFGYKIDFLGDRRLEIAGMISAATTLEELIGIRQLSLSEGTWVPDLQALGNAKRSELPA